MSTFVTADPRVAPGRFAPVGTFVYYITGGRAVPLVKYTGNELRWTTLPVATTDLVTTELDPRTAGRADAIGTTVLFTDVAKGVHVPLVKYDTGDTNWAALVAPVYAPVPEGSLTTTFLRADGTWVAPAGGGSLTVTEVAIPFTDGDTWRRVTIADAGVSGASKILGSLRRPNTTDANDPGFTYSWNIVTLAAGSFDIVVYCDDDPVEKPPNETLQFAYTVS